MNIYKIKGYIKPRIFDLTSLLISTPICIACYATGHYIMGAIMTLVIVPVAVISLKN
jgi:hypothetical protein